MPVTVEACARPRGPHALAHSQRPLGAVTGGGAMTWTLRIRHIDIGGTGDATLIVARDDGKDNAGRFDKDRKRTRSVLIDGGLVAGGTQVHKVIENEEKLDKLDVMICTHYDQDHVNGLRNLLGLSNSDIYKDTVVFDAGHPSNSNIEIRYLDAINGRKRPTSDVPQSGDDGSEDDEDDEQPKKKKKKTDTGAQKVKSQTIRPDWLVGQDLMWWNDDPPQFAPTLRCVAANQYVIKSGSKSLKSGTDTVVTTRLPSSLLLPADRLKNSHSLAFLLTFGKFKYYVAGDLESTQESGNLWDPESDLADTDGYVTNTSDSLMDYLGRVHAMKTSHHGSKFSSSKKFIEKLKPLAVFISTGTNNKYSHPDQPVLDNLDGCSAVKKYFLTGHFLPARAAKLMPATLGTKAVVAGAWSVDPQQNELWKLKKADFASTKSGDTILEIKQEDAGSAGRIKFKVTYDKPQTAVAAAYCTDPASGVKAPLPVYRQLTSDPTQLDDGNEMFMLRVTA
jgi:beta-lactamase superfamily II metal-dependent hydrolase